MLSIEQLTILSYITDGSVLCRKCGEDAGLPTKDAVCAYSTYEFAGSEGLTCDDCGKEIVEAYTWTCPDCDKVYYGEEAPHGATVHPGQMVRASVVSDFQWGFTNPEPATDRQDVDCFVVAR